MKTNVLFFNDFCVNIREYYYVSLKMPSGIGSLLSSCKAICDQMDILLLNSLFI